MKKNKIWLIIFLILPFALNINYVKAADQIVVCQYAPYELKFNSTDNSKSFFEGDKKKSDIKINFDVVSKDKCPDPIYVNIDEYRIKEVDSKKTDTCVNPMALTKSWVENKQSNVDDEDPDKEYELCSFKVSCGNVTSIPKKLPELTSYIVTIIQIVIPVILVIMGSIDLFKGITAGKEDEIKKGQQMFIKRLVIAAIIFFLFIIVKLVISLVANEENEKNILGCMKCFMYNDCVESDECAKEE